MATLGGGGWIAIPLSVAIGAPLLRENDATLAEETPESLPGAR
jgi:hypothetical protein